MAMTNRRPCLRRTHGPCDREVSDTDTDGDGTADLWDGCSADPGKSEPGVWVWVADTDTDGDGTADCVDRCDDNPALVESTRCGCEIETDEDGDGVPGCIDACPADPDKSESEGVCGCRVADTDTDDDGRYDCVDQCPLDPGKSEPGVWGVGWLTPILTGTVPPTVRMVARPIPASRSRACAGVGGRHRY